MVRVKEKLRRISQKFRFEIMAVVILIVLIGCFPKQALLWVVPSLKPTVESVEETIEEVMKDK